MVTRFAGHRCPDRSDRCRRSGPGSKRRRPSRSSPGWNAVWLEVEPVYPPATPRPASRRPRATSSTNPCHRHRRDTQAARRVGGIFRERARHHHHTFNQDEWQQWKRTDPAGRQQPCRDLRQPPLSGPRHRHGHGGLSLTGKVRFFRPTWTPTATICWASAWRGRAPSANSSAPQARSIRWTRSSP